MGSPVLPGARRPCLSLDVCIWLCRAAEVTCKGDITYTDAAPYQGLPLPTCGEDLFISMTLYTRQDNQTGKPVTRSSVPYVHGQMFLTVTCTLLLTQFR